MVHAFNDLEGLRIAAEMEKRGHEYYRRAAKLSKSPEAVDMLLFLAEDESRHQAEFQRLSARILDKHAEAADYSMEASAYLSAIAAEIIFTDGLIATAKKHGFDNPRTILEGAIESEKDSILFYAELERLTQDDESRAVFAEIGRQERGHMSQLMHMLSRIDE